MRVEKSSFTDRSLSQSQLNPIEFRDGRPTLGDETFPCHIVVEHVHRVIDGLDLLHFDLPCAKISRRGRENALTMILCLMKNDVEIFETRHHSHGQFSAFERILGTRIDIGTEPERATQSTDCERTSNEPLADLLHTILQLFALEEDDEHGLVNLLALLKERERG